MPAADFAAAQERIAARRAQRAAHARTQLASPPPSPALARLPFPLNRLSAAGFGAWDAAKGREGTRPAFRVGQLDAELLDDELLALLKGQLGEGLKYFGAHLPDTYAPEVLLALRVVLFKLGLWNNHASYGAHLQGLRYSDARSSAPSRPPPRPWQKAAYGLVTIGGRYAWSKWEAHLLAAEEDSARPHTARLGFLARATEALANAHDVASLASFLVFLANGRYRTLTDRLLRLRLTPTSHSTSRDVSFEYLNRQLVWHAFTEFLLFLLPLVGITRWRRILSRSVRRLRTAFLSLVGRRSPSSASRDHADDTDSPNSGPLAFLPDRTCAICYHGQNPSTSSEADTLTHSASSGGGGGVVGSAATDITNPYAADCGCLYCFACLAQRIAGEEGEGWSCLRCGAVVQACAPWEGDVVPSKTAPRISSPSRDSKHPHLHRESGSGSAIAKSVLFAQDEGEEDEEEEEEEDEDEELDTHTDTDTDTNPPLQHIPPSPLETDALLETTHALDLGDSLAFTETSAWAHASDDDDEDEDEDEDEQSEEYDEDEGEEGEELEADYEGM
ncbi:peroxisome assembly protein (Peroxin-2) [Ascochyta rabiei]|uniref:Zinc ion binding n=1 Tax=Didymella rabiei TaxID=5454 RepID=A0A163LGI4_DIDRA|nr:peroxisome assembly protein (Peroxin-2) [Ascochyta rabiei]KZM27784.1 zinc ion binding [Ascochyta rabiei]UPX11882.1 peroxisome assembly protein (Peroxin-2) [Ascochyta rabiei]